MTAAQVLAAVENRECSSQVLVAGVKIGIKQLASEKLWALYRTGGIRSLLEKPHSGQPGIPTALTTSANFSQCLLKGGFQQCHYGHSKLFLVVNGVVFSNQWQKYYS